MKLQRTKFQEKLNEALKAVLPIIGIVLVLCFTVAPISPSILMAFLIGAVLLVIGMMFFTLGVEISMTPMGERVGTCMTQSKKLPVMVLFGFLLGVVITVSEPDLQVLAEQVPSIPNLVLIFCSGFRGRDFPCDCLAAYAVWHSVILYASAFLWNRHCAGFFCTEGFSGGGI